jgi:autotransporter-associated beta strand protein
VSQGTQFLLINTNNATLTSTTGTVGSLNANGTSNFRIYSNTSGSTNSTLTLGGVGNNGNSFSGVATDLIYVSVGAEFTIQGPTAGTAVLRVALGQNGTVNIGGNATISSAISGTNFGLTKTGSGSLILTGANTYTGSTGVSEGTLRVNGTHAAAITVSTGATLGGNGTISGLVTLNSGANLTPGNGVGNLNFNGGLTLNATSTVTMEIDGASAFDTINVSSASLSYAGTLSLVFGYTPAVNATYQLFTGASVASASGNFLALNFNNPEYQGSYDPSSGVLTVTAIPEPQTWALLALGALTLLGINRKKFPLRFPNHAASQAVPNPNPIIPQI